MPSIDLFLLAWLVLDGILFIVVARMFWQERQIQQKLEQSGTTVQAEVVSKARKASSRAYSYEVVYRFFTGFNDPTNGYTARQSISEKHFANVGSTVTVSYLPGVPPVSRLVGPDADNIRLNTLRLTMLMCLTTTIVALVLLVVL